MKILHISNYYDPHIGGIEQVAKDVVNAYSGNKQKLICFNHEKGTKVDIIGDLEVTRVGCQIKVSSQSIALGFKKNLKKIIKSFNPEVIVFHYPNPFVAHYLLKCRKRNIKIITYWHLDITKQKILGKLFHGQNKRIIKHSNLVVAATPIHFETSKYSSYFGNKKVVIPFAIDTKRLVMTEEEINKSNKLINKDKEKFVGFFLGRHVPYKGLEYLIKASKLLDDKFKFYIAGAGPLTESLKELAQGDNKIEFIGKISDSDYRVHLNACNVFCFPSITRNEAFGLAQAEAMYYKKPVITFNIFGSGVNFVNLKDVSGLEAINSNPEDYANKLNELANNKELYAKLSNGAYNRAVELFNEEEFIKLTNENIK